MSTLSVGSITGVSSISANDYTFSNSISVGNSSVNSVINSSAIAIGGNTLTIGTGSYFVANGNVGIGKSSPSFALNVKAPSTEYRSALFETANAYGPSVQIKGSKTYELRSTDSAAAEGAGLFFIYDKDNEVSRITVGNTGYIGIGNTNPTSKLTVEGSGHFRGITLSNTAGLDIGYNTSYSFLTSGNRGANTLSPLDSEASYFRWLTGFGSSEQMRLNTTGLGIGTGSPAYKLDAYSSSAGDVSARFKASNGGAELLLDATNSFNSVRYLVSGTEKWRAGLVNSNNFVIYDYSAGTRMLVNSVGDIGIGEAAPVARLHVYQPNVQSYHGYATKFIDAQSASGNFIPHDFVQYYGNHSWGTVARFRIEAGSDKPSIQFSSVADNTRWNVGFCGYDESFRIVQNLGYRNDNSTQDGWGTERFKITNTGCITKPYQPAFISISKSGTFTYTGGQKVIYDQSVQNVGSNYSTASSRFTAPVAGFYLVKAQLWSHHTNVGCAWFYVNGSARYGSYGNEGQNISWNAYAMIEIFYLNANDYVEVYCRSGTTYTDSGFSTFSGYLLG